MKRFRHLHPAFQWAIALLFGVILVWILYWWMMTVSESIIWALLIFIMVPVIQFLSTPLFMLVGLYTYYSPMVVSFGKNDKVIDLHNGTSFDYLLEMRSVKPGLAWKKRMLFYYFTALLQILQKIEDKELSDSVVIRGSSYFLSQRSAERLGFTVSKTSFAEKLNISLNYLDLVWTYSLTNGTLTFPNLANISTVSITGKELLEQKQRIVDLTNRLQVK